MVKQEKAVTKDMLVGMQVIDAEGHILELLKMLLLWLEKWAYHYMWKERRAKEETSLGKKCKQ